MSKRNIFILLFLVATSAVWSQSLLMQGHQALSRDRYDRAIGFYRQALEQGTGFVSLEEIIEVLEIRKSLGEIEPEYVQKICAIYVTEINVEDDSGKTQRTRDITMQQKQVIELYQNLLTKIVEGFSAGAFSLEWDSVDAKSTYHEGQKLNAYNPDVLDLERFFFDKIDDFDTFITFSNAVRPPMGLARTYPYVNGAIYSPPRGMANVVPYSFTTLLHEYFHTIEWVSGGLGGPAHGWNEEGRDSYPDWGGETEFGYYRWHFDETLPTIGWEKLIHRRRWKPLENRSARELNRVLAAYRRIPLEDRQEVNGMLKLAGEEDDLGKATAMYEQALELSPYHPALLERLIRSYRFLETDGDALDSVLSRYNTVQSLSAFVPFEEDGWDTGTYQGAWNPAVVSSDEQVLEWTIDHLPPNPADYILEFRFTNGWARLDVSWVGLYENGVEISRDDHKGFSGKTSDANRYRLSFPVEDPTATYTLRAAVRAGGGGNSNGFLLLSPSVASAASDGEPFYEVPGTAYLLPETLEVFAAPAAESVGGTATSLTIAEDDSIIGTWTPRTITEDGSVHEWDLAGFLSGDGTYVVEFLYTKGWKAVEIAWAALCEDGAEVTRDTHDGWSGSKKENIDYVLRLDQYNPDASYTLKARLKGVTGTDSNGEVRVRKE